MKAIINWSTPQVTYEPYVRVGDKEIYLAREHMKHVKMIADLTKNALQQQTSTRQDMRRFSNKIQEEVP